MSELELLYLIAAALIGVVISLIGTLLLNIYWRRRHLQGLKRWLDGGEY